MKILITGGSGFVGRNLVRLMPGFGHTVLAPTHAEMDMIDVNGMLMYMCKHKPDASTVERWGWGR